MMVKSRFGEEVDEYLSLKGKTTRGIYSSAFGLFLEYYRNKHGEEKGLGDFLDRIFEEMKKPRREQRRIAEIEMVDFINYLKQLGKSNNTIRGYFAAVQNFLKYKQLVVSARFIGNLPPAVEKPTNHKHEWTIEELKIFLDSAPTYRDKAIIVCLFQSGLGVNELVNLSYGDIQEDFEKGRVPICLKLVRQKTGVPFKTFFGCDSLKYLRLYLQTRKNLISDSPLFTKWGSEERITTGAIQQRFSEIAKDLPFIKKKELEGFNPCRPHSLRAAFKSKLINKISDELIDFWMGHELGSTKDAYLNMPTEELRELYMDAEKYLAIEETSREELTKLEKGRLEISAEIEQKIKGLETTVSVLTDRMSRWERFSERFFGLSLEVLTELEEEPQTSQNLIKISEEKKEEVPIIKTVKKARKPSFSTISKKEPVKHEKPVEHEEKAPLPSVRKNNACPECGSHSLKNGSCSECGYHE